MVKIRIDLASQVERYNVRIAAVIYEPCFISIEHTVQAQREEFIVEDLLDDLLSLVSFGRVIKVKQVRKAVGVVVSASHIALLLTHNLA